MAEAMLFNTGVLDRMGKVEDGNTAMDFDDEEKKRGMSIYTSLAPCQWKEYKINCLDVPGFLDFVGEIKSSISVIEGAILFASANSIFLFSYSNSNFILFGSKEGYVKFRNKSEMFVSIYI